MHWARMFSSGSFSPVCLSTPVSIRPSRSVVSTVSPAGPSSAARRSAMSRSTRSFMNAWSSSSLPLRADAQPGLDRQLPDPGLGLGEGAHHRFDERVRGVAVEGVEPVAEAAQRDRVERQPGHVRRDVDLLARVEPRPLVHQLVGDVEHLGHVVAHRLQAERRHEDVVRPVPERVVGVRGEQPRAQLALAQVRQPAADLLVEPRVVAHLVDELRPGQEAAVSRQGWRA